jgi:hypothetical protein
MTCVVFRFSGEVAFVFHHRRIWFAACLLLLGGLWFSGMTTSAADNKKDEKKKDIEPIFRKSEELTNKDEKDTHPLLKHSPRKTYSVKLSEGKVYQIDLKSKDFDSVLRLEDSSGKEVAFNDDAPGEKTLDARIFYKATATAEFKIIATCLNRKAGKFTLTVIEAVGLASASLFKAEPIDLKWKDGKVRFAGDLTEQDSLVFDHYNKVFSVQLKAGKTYRFDHQSDDFDAYLFLEDPYGNTLAQDDDGGAGTNSRIVHAAAKTGAYRVIATTRPARTTGKFVLEISPEKSVK